MAWEPRSPFIGQEFPNWFGNVFRKSTADILLHDAGRGLYSLKRNLGFFNLCVDE